MNIQITQLIIITITSYFIKKLKFQSVTIEKKTS